ncbi:hypothetical protein DCAR_0936170 [Daucus carota subsp. sativus]|uniref:Anther-specific protein BCP1 n=1 Tax=Daucus carota subsp. sativus TaxID=79200 RepID=A0A175YIR6_DAUCS|nr:hypothetical protein DCAR_0936170 [Daucus carota subsp. sativus]
MARKLIVLALVLFVIVGLVSAAKPADHDHDDVAEAADAPSDDAREPAEGPSDDIGTDDDNDDAAPVGGPVPAGAFPASSSTGQSTSPGASAASALEVSAIAGIAAGAAGAAFFF